MTERNHITAAILGDVINRQVPYWGIGVCTVRYSDGREELYVNDENGHSLDSWSVPEYHDKLTELADEVNEAIEHEHSQL